MEFGTGGINEIEDNAFDAEAFKSVKQLIITKMDLYHMKRGLFNGLESLEILNLKHTSLIQSVDMGILDALNQTLKEFTIEHDNKRSTHIPMTIESFTGSQQTLRSEFVRVRYYLHRLTSTSLISLTNVKYLDVSYCGIQYIEEDAFDPVIDSIKVLRLTGNQITELPAGMWNMVPLRYSTYIFVGKEDDCECSDLPINFVVKVNCELQAAEADKVCNSFLPIQLRTTTSMTTNTPPTTVLTSSTTSDSTVPPTHTELTTSAVNFPSTTVTTPSSTSPIRIAEIKEFKSGDVIVCLNEAKANLTLIWFLSDEQADTTVAYRKINCLISRLNSRCTITVHYLKEQTMYTFCVVDDAEEIENAGDAYAKRVSGRIVKSKRMSAMSETNNLHRRCIRMNHHIAFNIRHKDQLIYSNGT